MNNVCGGGERMLILACRHLSFVLFEMFTCEFDCFFGYICAMIELDELIKLVELLIFDSFC